ncbi:hypothetical protein V1511DRAFT_510713 [Dipodascopsis uninucleata]
MISTALAIFALILQALAIPELSFPVSVQYPPVARLNDAYDFEISSYTFDSSEGSISYAAENLPSWLSFDESSLKFSGTPSDSSDLGYFDITLIASDSTGSANETVTLVVVNTKAPTVQDPCVAQLLSNYTAFTGNGISIASGTNFAIQFSSDTFLGNVSSIDGVTASRTPMPSWIKFDSSSWTFEGTTPAVSSLVAPPVTFSFMLLASDVSGYYAVGSQFDIYVGLHTLTVSSATLNVTEGENFNTTLDVKLDGQEITSEEIANLTLTGLENWMSFNESSLTLSGTPDDDDAENFMVVVLITDTYGDSVEANINITLVNDIFLDSIDNQTATQGGEFNFTIPIEQSKYSEVSVSYDPDSAGNWLEFDQKHLSLSGEVPSNFEYVMVTVTVVTSSDNKENAKFYINGKAPITATTTITTSTTSQATVSATQSSTLSATSAATTTETSGSSTTSSSGTSKKTVAILLGVLIPVGLLIAGFIIYYCCFIAAAASTEYNESDNDAESTTVRPPGGGSTSVEPEDNWPLPPTKPNRDSGLSMFSNHRRTYSDLEKEYTEVGGFVIPYDPDDAARPKKSRIFSRERDSLSSLATVATTEIFSVRLVDSMAGDTGMAETTEDRTSMEVYEKHKRSRSTRSGGSSDSGNSGGSSTIGAYSTGSSGVGEQRLSRLYAVREEDIGDDRNQFVAAPRVSNVPSDFSTPLEGSEVTSINESDISSQQFQMVSGQGVWIQERSNNLDAYDSDEPRLVEFQNGGRPANRGGESYEPRRSSTDDGPAFL